MGRFEQMVRLAKIGMGLVAAGAAVMVSACSLSTVSRGRGEPVVRQVVAADAEQAWEGVRETVDRLGLVVTDERPESRYVELDWLTADGDGRRYLVCRGTEGPVGNASLQPRIVVRDLEVGSAIEISTVARATVGSACVSTGAYERWLLTQIQPAVAASATVAQ